MRASVAARSSPTASGLLETSAMAIATAPRCSLQKRAAATLQVSPEIVEGLELFRRLPNSFAKDLNEMCTRVTSAPFTETYDKRANLCETQTKCLGLPDECESTQLNLGVESISARAACGGRHQSSTLVETNGPDRESRASSRFADLHFGPAGTVRHRRHRKASTIGESQWQCCGEITQGGPR